MICKVYCIGHSSEFRLKSFCSTITLSQHHTLHYHFSKLLKKLRNPTPKVPKNIRVPQIAVLPLTSRQTPVIVIYEGIGLNNVGNGNRF